MNPIRTNKPVFFGEDGDVLKSGKIYIGQPNQWPLDFPKTVTFQDSAGSQFTAKQPLRTNRDGRINYNGKAIIALVDGDYSMLVRDRNDVTVPDGYTPFVENTEDGGGSTEGVTQVGTLLSDIKLLDVTPGETVRNVGKDVALDDLGADWLVVSATGGTADDIDLIDFANGTQGRRINNQFYRSQSDILQWLGVPVGGYISIQDNLPGVSEPPTDSTLFRYVKLTAGQSGSGQYNDGIITNESVTGTAPLVVATGDIVEGPMAGATVNLINTEGRYVSPGESAGSVANDHIQNITGSIGTPNPNNSGVFDRTGSGALGASDNRINAFASGADAPTAGTLTFDASGSARTSDNTNVKRIQATYYMRVK